MDKEDIIFFEQLGFGWVVEQRVIRGLIAGKHRRKPISEHFLLERSQREDPPAQ
jgi:hypothetical protein